MKPPNHYLATFALASLTACASPNAPAHADALPPGFQMRHTDHINTPQASAPARSNRGVTLLPELPPIDSPALRGGPTIGGKPSGLIYDTPLGWMPTLTAETLLASARNNGGNLQSGGNGNGNNGCGNGNGGPSGRKDCDQPEPPTPPDPNTPSVPGPVPLLGLGAAFAYSRKLRQRIK